MLLSLRPNKFGSRQHPAEKKWRCGANYFLLFTYFLARSNRDILMPANMHLMVYEQYKFHLSIVFDM